jgi:hypothetical protein
MIYLIITIQDKLLVYLIYKLNKVQFTPNQQQINQLAINNVQLKDKH